MGWMVKNPKIWKIYFYW